MFKFSRRTNIILIVLALIVIGYFAIKFFRGGSGEGAPQDFTDARLQGAIIGQNIVNLSNQSTSDLEKINQFDDAQNYGAAVDLVTNLVGQTQQIRDQAVSLSTQVESMTKSLSDITNFDARQAALESISSRLALINSLINYSGDLSKLLDLLKARFAGTGGSNAEVHAMVDQINTDVNAINNFNSQAGQAMDRFDKLVK